MKKRTSRCHLPGMKHVRALLVRVPGLGGSRNGRCVPSRQTLLIGLLLGALLPQAAKSQVPAVAVWAGPVVDWKPDFPGVSPFGASSNDEVNEGLAVGVSTLLIQTTLGAVGLSGGFVTFRDDVQVRERRQLNLLATLRRELGDDFYLDWQLGVGRASWKTGSGAGSSHESLDWLVGPALVWRPPVGSTMSLELGTHARFRWSPDYSDYLSLGLSLGLAIHGTDNP